LPAVHFHQRFLLGMIWGWLPCGLVYSTLAIAAAQGSGLRGAAMLAAFGAGTLPGMVAAQFGVQRLRHTLQRLRLQFLAACLLLASGVVLLLMQGPWAASHGPLHDHGRGGTHPTHVHPSSPER
jgi:sulfite exporter TauE/SafE